MDNNQKAALGILGAVAAAFTAMKMKESKGSMYPSGSFYADNDEPQLPAGNYLSEMMISESADPFLGQAVQPYRGRRIQNPEYTLMFDLVDADLIPLPEMMVTTPNRPYGPTNMAAMRQHFRPNPRGILKANQIGYLTSKSQFFAAVELIKPMVQEDFDMINLVEGQDGNFDIQPALMPHAGFGIARPQDVGNYKHYRINLMGLASQGGRPLMDGILPFSNLFHSFEMYASQASAEMAYDNAYRRLQEWMGQNNISMTNRRRLR